VTDGNTKHQECRDDREQKRDPRPGTLSGTPLVDGPVRVRGERELVDQRLPKLLVDRRPWVVGLKARGGALKRPHVGDEFLTGREVGEEPSADRAVKEDDNAEHQHRPDATDPQQRPPQTPCVAAARGSAWLKITTSTASVAEKNGKDRQTFSSWSISFK
jgi:hypothetical protein